MKIDKYKLLYLLNTSGLSRDEFYKKARVGNRTVMKIMRHCDISHKVAERLAKFFGCTTEAIIENETVSEHRQNSNTPERTEDDALGFSSKNLNDLSGARKTL